MSAAGGVGPASDVRLNARRAARLGAIYARLFERLGPQHWWPGDGTRDTIVLGAVLTQNTAWPNVERALARLRGAGACSLRAVAALPPARLADLIRPSGYFNVKARRLHATAAWFGAVCDFDLARLDAWPTPRLREGLLSIVGVGPETADDILVYAFERPSFVVDAYTRRLLERHGFARGGESYGAIQAMWAEAVPATARDHNEAHALIVRLAKVHCTKRAPDCAGCPLNAARHFASAAAHREWMNTVRSGIATKFTKNTKSSRKSGRNSAKR